MNMAKIFLSISLCAISAVTVAQNKCVNIYYDQIPNQQPTYFLGRYYAINLQNLLGHFPHLQQYISPIHLYKKNDIERCQATFYFGSDYNAKKFIPPYFYQDVINTKKNIVLMNYGIWNFKAEDLKKLLNVRLNQFYNADSKQLDEKGRPGFYKYFTYKGEIFEKYGELDPASKNNFLAADEIVGVELLSKDTAKNVVSWAIHSANKSKIPYILHKDNYWFIADNPFSFMYENDRYLIMTDVLFDILNENPLDNGKHYALVRIEDISAKTLSRNLKIFSKMFAKLKAPFTISLIPIFADPNNLYSRGRYVELIRRRWFLDALHDAVSQGGSILMHGVTHQYDSVKNPFSAVSGDDYEFWDKVHNKPIPEDSVPFVVNRLETGASLINKANLQIKAWLPPHYLTSPLDETLFGDLFTFIIGRGNYTITNTCNMPKLSENLTLDHGIINKKTNAERLQILSPIKVYTAANTPFEEQFFPYVIYGDYYNQRIIPEDLEYLVPATNKESPDLRSVDDMLRDAKRNLVIRDSWASFYIHEIVLNSRQNKGLGKYNGDTKELERLVKGLQNLGYKFVDLNTWEPTHLIAKRPTPIEIAPLLPSCK